VQANALWLVDRWWFASLVVFCIVANTVLLALEWEGQSQEFRDKLDQCNLFLSAVFLFEMVAKLLACVPTLQQSRVMDCARLLSRRACQADGCMRAQVWAMGVRERQDEFVRRCGGGGVRPGDFSLQQRVLLVPPYAARAPHLQARTSSRPEGVGKG
jgi:hypothetical protein